MRLRPDLSLYDAPAGRLAFDPLRQKVFALPPGIERDLARNHHAAALVMMQAGLLEGWKVAPVPQRPRQKILVSRSQLPSETLRAWDETRFDCVACGESCRTIERGPLPQSERARLFALPLASIGVNESQVFYAKDGEDLATTERLFLGPEGEACGFLRPDGRCALHVEFGASAKPLMCRAFPFMFVATPQGLTVGARLPECTSAVAARAGRKATEQLDELRPLVDGFARFEFVPPSVRLDATRWLSFTKYATWETSTLAEAHPDWLARRTAEFVGESDAAIDVRAAMDTFAKQAARDHAEAAKDRSLALIADRVIDVVVAASGSDVASSPEALEIDRVFARQFVWNKQLFDFPDLATGLAVLATRRHVARRYAAARSNTGADASRGWRAAEAFIDAQAIGDAGFTPAIAAAWVRAFS